MSKYRAEVLLLQVRHCHGPKFGPSIESDQDRGKELEVEAPKDSHLMDQLLSRWFLLILLTVTCSIQIPPVLFTNTVHYSVYQRLSESLTLSCLRGISRMIGSSGNFQLRRLCLGLVLF